MSLAEKIVMWNKHKTDRYLCYSFLSTEKVTVHKLKPRLSRNSVCVADTVKNHEAGKRHSYFISIRQMADLVQFRFERLYFVTLAQVTERK